MVIDCYVSVFIYQACFRDNIESLEQVPLMDDVKNIAYEKFIRQATCVHVTKTLKFPFQPSSSELSHIFSQYHVNEGKRN
jgi:hypothetical protein